FRDQQFGGVGVDGLVDGRHHAHTHQRLDDVARPLGHAVGEFLDRDAFGHHDVAQHLGRLGKLGLGALFLTLAGTPHRSEAARALVLVGEGAGDRDLAAVPSTMLRVAAGRGRGPPCVGTEAGAAPRRFFLRLEFDLDLAGRGQRGDLGGGRLAGALGDLGAARVFLGLALGLGDAAFVISLALRLFLVLALGLFLVLALGLFERLAVGLVGGAAAGLQLAVGGLDLGLALGVLARPDRALKRARAARRFLGCQAVGQDQRAALGLDSRGGRRRCLGGGLGRGRRGAFRRRRGHDPLFPNLDGYRLGAAMGEALSHLAGFGRTLQLELTAAAEAQFLLGIRLVGLTHSRSKTANSLTRRSPRKPASRPNSTVSAAASAPSRSATCTALSRPNAPPSSAAVSSARSGTSGARARSLPRPSRAPSAAPISNPATPADSIRSTLTKPIAASPARRANPISSPQRAASNVSTRSGKASSTLTGRRAARPNSRFATASATISRRAVNHKPRPGNRPATSGTMVPSGDTTNRTSAAFGRTSPVTRQRRVAPLSSSSS